MALCGGDRLAYRIVGTDDNRLQKCRFADDDPPLSPIEGIRPTLLIVFNAYLYQMAVKWHFAAMIYINCIRLTLSSHTACSAGDSTLSDEAGQRLKEITFPLEGGPIFLSPMNLSTSDRGDRAVREQ